jgi:outer membrane protein TolC
MQTEKSRAQRLPSPVPGLRPPAPFVLCLLLVANLQAQVLPAIAPVKPGGMPFIRSYQAVQAPPLRSPSSLRWRSLVRGGNLYLTVHDALELAIEASLDLEIERYNMVMAGWSLQRFESGGALRGVTGANAPAVTLGAGQGVAGSQHSSITTTGGSTATIAGAALIQQIGPVTPQLDPIYAAGVTFAHQTTPQDQLVQSGTNELVDTARSYSFQMREGLLTGGTVRETYNGSYLNEAVPLDVLNPTSYISLGISVTHQLLQGFGERVNGRFIRIQRRRAANSGRVFEQRLSAVVANTLTLYWDLAVASGDLKYKQRNRDIASRFLADTERQIAAGAVPAIDRVHARSALAVGEQALSVAQSALVERENAMKDALSWHGRYGSELDAVHVIAVDPLVVPASDDLPPVGELLANAIGRRPDLAIARSNVEIAEIGTVGTANGILPRLAVGASTSNVGQTGRAVPGQAPDPYFVGGSGSALGQVFRRNYPNERVGAQFTAPLANSQAQADLAIDQLSHRQSQLAAQRAVNQLALDISNQVLALEQARARYQSAVESRTLVGRLLEGEEKKWLAGSSTIATVVNARRDMATAESSELAAASAYMRSRIALDQDLSATLEANHISVDGAAGQ